MSSLKSYLTDGVPVRRLLVTLTLVTTGYASAVFAGRIWSNGLHLLDIPLLLLFVILFGWISVSFWISTLGFVVALMRRPARAQGMYPRRRFDRPPQTALVMPIYNESPLRVFAGLRAMYESIRRTGHGKAFDLFVLSDTTDPETWLEEERQYADLRAAVDDDSRIFYRRRLHNSERKSGNIADFCRRWGSAYTYMVILDADSVMAGTTLLEMVWRMEASPDLGILQAPPVPASRGSLFARCQQFAASVYGEAFSTGFALWTQTDANYFGHNAIIRVAAFMKSAGLPRLPGNEPLGGEILSHDFVEAALMRRAGWKIRVDEDLAGSYEECPTTLIDYAKRDQRWCQGNMQHVRLLFLYGFHPVSRVHLGMGAMSYLSSPLWLLFLLIGWSEAAIQPPAFFHLGAYFPAPIQRPATFDFAVIVAMLLLPKVWGLILLYRSDARLDAHGGPVRAAFSVMIETAVSALIAPILMAFHAMFVVSTLAGHTVKWQAQRRGDASHGFLDAAQAHGAQTLAGVAATLLTFWVTPQLFWWFSPVLAGLVLAIPISAALGSTTAGLWLKKKGLLLTPEETAAPRELVEQRYYIDELSTREQHLRGLDPFERVILDPALNSLHIGILKATGAAGKTVEPSIRRAAAAGQQGLLRREEKLALLADPESLIRMHHAAWSQWPLDALHLAAAILARTPPPVPKQDAISTSPPQTPPRPDSSLPSAANA